jgi:putative holliday junction resolvase
VRAMRLSAGLGALPSVPVRALGLDVGSRTIGVALSDALGLAAHPLITLSRKGTAADVAALCALCREHEVDTVVIGWPLEMSGAVGPRARRVGVLCDALAAALGPGVPIHRWDERFSTVAVERVLLEADLSRKKRKAVIDRSAAAYILQGWLDGERPK